jgi:hypothetical protein
MSSGGPFVPTLFTTWLQYGNSNFIIYWKALESTRWEAIVLMAQNNEWEDGTSSSPCARGGNEGREIGHKRQG